MKVITRLPKICKDKILSDAVFGFITLKPYIISIIDTPEFQRLRKIWQLGLTPFVYPTADHSRFEHSIGTYWLASKIVTKLQKQLVDENVKEIEISEKDVMCVEIAALCHDIGHGPFSHFWDNKVLRTFCKSILAPHEEQFSEIWKILKKNKKVESMIKEKDLNEKDEELINALIQGKAVKGKEILFGIVSNSESGMDVDKWDYLARDSSYLGHSSTNYRVDIERMLHFVRAIKDENGNWKIAFRDTETLNILRVFQLRHYIHQTAYQHRTVVAIEEMVLDGFQKCIDKNTISVEEIGTATWILKNTDDIFWSNVDKISEFKAVLTRDLYKPLYEAVKYDKVTNPKEEIIDYLVSKGLEVEYLRFAFCEFDLGKQNSNPIFEIPFYNKNDENRILKFTKETLPLNLNVDYTESRIIIFIKPGENLGKGTDKIKTVLEIYFEENNWRKFRILLEENVSVE